MAMAACRRAAWAAWTCNDDESGRKKSMRRNSSVPVLSHSAGMLRLDVSTNVSVKGLRVVLCMAGALKVADRDPLMNPRILQPRLSAGLFFARVCQRVFHKSVPRSAADDAFAIPDYDRESFTVVQSIDSNAARLALCGAACVLAADCWRACDGDYSATSCDPTPSPSDCDVHHVRHGLHRRDGCRWRLRQLHRRRRLAHA